MVEFHRDYLLRLPLPLAQLYSRAYNAKDSRGCHDNCFYLMEAVLKLAACPMVAAYAQTVRQGGQRVAKLDDLLCQLALPSLGQWAGIVQELARYFGALPDAKSHPLGHLWGQLEQKHRHPSAIVALYRRIKNGPDGVASSDTVCTLRELFNAVVQYRNLVFGHGANRFEAFYEQEMGPLLFPAVNEVLADGVFEPLGPKGTRLVYLTELRGMGPGRFELGMRELVGLQGERMAPLAMGAEHAATLSPNRVAVWWPGGRPPLPLDPMLAFRESEVADEVLFLNRDRAGKQVEYLSYTTGRTGRMTEMAGAMTALMSCLRGVPVDESALKVMAEEATRDVVVADKPVSDSTAPPHRVLGDYELLAEIGHGGMGVVYLARQLSLGRLVAMKTIAADLLGDELAMARFQRETRAISHCDHPNIVKLLDSGSLPDGTAYYTMEYVEGCDLEQVWREVSRLTALGGSSSLTSVAFSQAVLTASEKRQQHLRKRCETRDSDGTGLPLPVLSLRPLPPLPGVHDDPGGYIRKIVSLMRDVALALQAVHDQHVVHRDISPANLLLTADGSRIVLMDFGLAKGQSITSSISKQGGFVGKLRYAAPEQLAAAMLPVGLAADVRGLGVTLWELLTRHRLFGDVEDERQLAAMILEKDVPPLREIDPTLDADLEAIVARATERSAGDRIDSAARLAEYMQLYLDGKPLPIRPPTATEMLRRWVRAHKPLVASISAAAAIVLITTIVAFVLITAARNRAIDLARRESEARQQARRAEKSAEQQRDLALDTLKKLVFEIQDKLESRVGMHALRESLLQTAIDGIQRVQDSLRNPAANRNTAYALTRLAGLFQVTGRTESAIESLQKARSLLETLAAESSNAQTRQDLVMVYEELAKAHLALNKPRQAMEFAEKEIKLAEQLHSADSALDRPLAVACCTMGDIHLKLGQASVAIEDFRRGIAIAESKAATQPDNPVAQRRLATFHSRMGDAYCELGDTAKAWDCYLEDLRITETLARDPKDYPSQRDLIVSYSRLSDLSLTMGQTDTAVKYLAKSHKIALDIAAAQPADTLSQNDLAISLGRLGVLSLKMGNPQHAADTYQKALAIRKELAGKEPGNAAAQRNLSTAYLDVAQANLRLNEPELAMEHYREAINLRKSLAEADKDNPAALRDLSIVYSDMGDAYLGAGRTQLAMESYQNAWQITRNLAGTKAPTAQARRDLAISLDRLGAVNLAMDRAEAARSHYRDAIAIYQSIADADPQSAEARRDVANGLFNLAGLHFQSGDFANAAEHCRKAVVMYDDLARDSQDAEVRHNLFLAMSKLGDIHGKQQQNKEASSCYGKALQVAEAMLAANPNNPEAQRDASMAYTKLGGCNLSASENQQALERFNTSLAMDRATAAAHPDVARAQADVVSTLVNVAAAFTALGRHTDAAACYREACEIACRMERSGTLLEGQADWPKLLEAAAAEATKKTPSSRPATRP